MKNEKTALVVAQMKFEYARNYMQLPHNKTVSPQTTTRSKNS